MNTDNRPLYAYAHDLNGNGADYKKNSPKKKLFQKRWLIILLTATSTTAVNYFIMPHYTYSYYQTDGSYLRMDHWTGEVCSFKVKHSW